MISHAMFGIQNASVFSHNHPGQEEEQSTPRSVAT